MMNFSKKRSLALILMLSTSSIMFSQEKKTMDKVPIKDNYESGLKFNLDQSGKKYVRFLIWNQFWLKENANNPNTLVNGVPSDHTFDIGIRRARLMAYAQLSDRFLIVSHIGMDNQSFSTGGAAGTTGTGGYGAGKKPGLFMHDAYGEYAIIPDYNISENKKNKFSLYLGAGLHFRNGISRLSSSSTINMMTLDVPIINWPLIENSDQFGRQLGIYVKGNFERFSYNIAVGKPFATNISPSYNPIKNRVAVDNNGDAKPSIQSYIDYQFFDKESNLLPYRVGTYLGAKKVFNIGAGFYHNADGTKSMGTGLDATVKSHDINLFALDIYGDMPIGNPSKHAAISFYSAYYNYNFGPNYFRNIGIMNVSSGLNPSAAAGTSGLSGSGNASMLIGTGQFVYAHIGYLLPIWFNQQKIRLMPYVSNTFRNMQVSDQNANAWNIGSNFFISGHNAKITAEYSSRPLYFVDGNKYLLKDRKGQFNVQFQVFL